MGQEGRSDLGLEETEVLNTWSKKVAQSYIWIQQNVCCEYSDVNLCIYYS